MTGEQTAYLLVFIFLLIISLSLHTEYYSYGYFNSAKNNSAAFR